MSQSDIGVIGMAVMGQNLALNMESKGFTVSVFNRTTERTREFKAQRGQGKNVVATETLSDFVASLQRPRKAVILVKAGAAVDAVIDELVKLMEPGDIIIDGGNSHFTDTERRTKSVEARGLRYLGTGVSGGEYGALHGPSIMPGGTREAYHEVEPIFTKAAAQVDGPCCTYLGPRSAGHYVKMVHNGIEYGIMQLLGEAYDLMQRGLGLSVPEMQAEVARWDAGELSSYLVEITADILTRKDPENGRFVVDLIVDRAQQKGTGKWTAQSALDVGIPIPTITAATEARVMSSFKQQREVAAKVLSGPEARYQGDRQHALAALQDAVYLAVVSCYAQGMQLLAAASEEYNYELNLAEVARIWKGGCIIRSVLLDPIAAAYKQNPKLHNLLVAEPFASEVNRRHERLRGVVANACEHGIPVPALGASLHYIDGYRTARLPANLTQAQRDYFGAHTYERVDKSGAFHTEWQDIHNI
ncbi:MAG TPA: NADP-dependent phosphogluconate dehydrogenase [Limnochordia bacterium]|nr:NADP-dependent phosphogluconate dehydrogenase [Limnochordia bacterium]